MLSTMADDRAPPSTRVPAPASTPTGVNAAVQPGPYGHSEGARAGASPRELAAERYIRQIFSALDIRLDLIVSFRDDTDRTTMIENACTLGINVEVIVYRDWFDQTAAYQRRSTIHEAVHVLWDPYTRVAQAGLRGRALAAVLEAEEHAVERTARLLEPHFPYPDF
jgi:hypothetical protein